MKPSERENIRYANDPTNPTGIDGRLIFSLLPSLHGMLLDVGCGNDAIEMKLADIGFDAYGIDFSEVAVGPANEAGLRANVCDMDTDGIPCPVNTFDVVWLGNIPEHLFDPISLLKQESIKRPDENMPLISTFNDIPIGNRLKFFIGCSQQFDVYRKNKQCKRHTFMSKELPFLMIDHTGLMISEFYAVCRIPKIGVEFVSKQLHLTTLQETTLTTKATEIRCKEG
jgi:2-polyprenyl-3-methyl-5-hydroxy-6-metoxy-1,4-benzoquinol methylase